MPSPSPSTGTARRWRRRLRPAAARRSQLRCWQRRRPCSQGAAAGNRPSHGHGGAGWPGVQQAAHSRAGAAARRGRTASPASCGPRRAAGAWACWRRQRSQCSGSADSSRLGAADLLWSRAGRQPHREHHFRTPGGTGIAAAAPRAAWRRSDSGSICVGSSSSSLQRCHHWGAVCSRQHPPTTSAKPAHPPPPWWHCICSCWRCGTGCSARG